MENNRNLLIAVGLSVLILLGFHYLYEKPRMEALRQQQLIAQQQAAQQPQQQTAAAPADQLRDRAAVMAESPRVRINTPALHGSVNLKGGRIDDVTLANYRETIDPDSPEIVLLSPAGSAMPHQAYYVEFGWLGQNVKVPDAATVWQADSAELRADRPLRLTWDNGEGLQFERSIAVDEHFMFTITDRVKNATPDRTVTLFPFGLVSRHGQPPLHDLFILHEGAIGVFDRTLREHKYKDLVKEGKMTEHSQGGWLGFADKYWLTALVPDQNEAIDATFSFSPDKTGADKAPIGIFQSDFRSAARELAPGSETVNTLRLFVGAKELRQLYSYKDQYQIPMFENAIDFGWFFFLTKPFLYLLDMLGRLLGNFGLAILLFTVLLRLATLPLSMKSYESMARMKNLQPEITKLQERHKEDQMQLSVAMMELYKKEKVNPMSGCIPNLIQIPIFFALYKVLFVGIELRHAPFYGWVQDLSAPDPTNVLALFGLLPWSWIPHVGVWPILMGLSMWLQMRLSPQPPDKTQAMIFAWMPLLFTFMLAPMAAGLIIYWTWSNLLGIAQQWLIMKRAEQQGSR
jgi:YidC/Oxa1 family membrane protein insertase